MEFLAIYDFDVVDFFDGNGLFALLKCLVCIVAEVVFNDDEVSFLPNGN